MPETPDYSEFRWQDWRSGVPSEQTIIEQTTIAPGKLTGGMVSATFESARLATGIAWRSLNARTDATPASADAMGAFDSLGGLLSDVPVGAFDKMGAAAVSCVNGETACADLILDAQLDIILKVMGQAVSSVPVLGWIVQGIAFGVVVGKVIWLEAQDPPDPTAAPLTLNQAADQDAGNRIVSALDSPDWTPLWLPPHDGHGETYFQHINVEYGTGYEGSRLWLGNALGAAVPLGEGLMPGQSGAAQQWQTRMEQASTGSTRLDALANFLGIPIAHGSGDASSIGKTTTYPIGYFRPSLPQLNQLLWGEVSKVDGEAMWRVNADRLSEGWDGYWGRWEQIFDLFVQDGTKTQQQILWNILQGGALPAGWSDALRPVRTGLKAQGQVNPDLIPERYRRLQNGGMEIVSEDMLFLGTGTGCNPCLIPSYELKWGSGWRWAVTQAGVTRYVLDNFRERQEYALQTLMVAYLTGSEPGLGGKGSAMFIEWETNRDKLLTSPWRHSVDMDRVPKTDWTGTGDWRKLLASKRLEGLKLAPAMKAPPRLHGTLNVWGQGNFPTDYLAPKPAVLNKPDAIDLGGGAGAAGIVALMALAFGMRR